MQDNGEDYRDDARALTPERVAPDPIDLAAVKRYESLQGLSGLERLDEILALSTSSKIEGSGGAQVDLVASISNYDDDGRLPRVLGAVQNEHAALMADEPNMSSSWGQPRQGSHPGGSEKNCQYDRLSSTIAMAEKAETGKMPEGAMCRVVVLHRLSSWPSVGDAWPAVLVDFVVDSLEEEG